MDNRLIINTLIRIKELIELENIHKNQVYENVAIKLIDRTIEELRD